MSLMNHATKEIHCKIVYYGPSLGGKTTNLQWIYEKTAGDDKSKLKERDTGHTERTLLFDFLPVMIGEFRGYRTRFHIYSVPGQIDFDSRRKLILKGIDGVIFVADSQTERLNENLQSLDNLEKNLTLQGYDIKEIPFVIQYNKRDLKNAAPLNELKARINKYNVPDFEAVAQSGKGVMETFSTLSKSIVSTLKGAEIS